MLDDTNVNRGCSNSGGLPRIMHADQAWKDSKDFNGGVLWLARLGFDLMGEEDQGEESFGNCISGVLDILV